MIPPELNPTHLSFRDTRAEAAFREDDQSRLLLQGRMALLVAISSYLALGLLFDAHLFPSEHLGSVWAIRLAALMVPCGVLIFTGHRWFKSFSYLSLALVGLAGGLGLIGMLMFLPAERVASYYPALILVIFTYNLVGTRFIHALGVDLILLLAYNLATLARGRHPLCHPCPARFLHRHQQLIGGGAGYLTELQRRRLYLGEQRLRQEVMQTETARQYADATNQAKSRFLAAVSRMICASPSTPRACFSAYSAIPR